VRGFLGLYKSKPPFGPCPQCGQSLKQAVKCRERGTGLLPEKCPEPVTVATRVTYGKSLSGVTGRFQCI